MNATFPVKKNQCIFRGQTAAQGQSEVMLELNNKPANFLKQTPS
jgi:hypothetical protein